MIKKSLKLILCTVAFTLAWGACGVFTYSYLYPNIEASEVLWIMFYGGVAYVLAHIAELAVKCVVFGEVPNDE